IAVVAAVGWALGRELADKRRLAAKSAAPLTGSNGQASTAAQPVDVIHEAWAVAPRAERTHRLLEFLAPQDPRLDPGALRRDMEVTFYSVQECWQKGDYAPLGDTVLPSIRREHERQLAAMQANGERNVLDGLRVERLELVHVSGPARGDALEVA